MITKSLYLISVQSFLQLVNLHDNFYVQYVNDIIWKIYSIVCLDSDYENRNLYLDCKPKFSVYY